MNFKTSLAEYIDRRMTDLLAMQNPDGSFGPYPLTNAQYPFYTMAYALKKLPGSHRQGSAQLRTALIQALEHYYHQVGDNGLAEFYGMAGLKWGKCLTGDWPMFCWQETLILLEPDLPPELFLRHREKILKIVALHSAEAVKKMTDDPIKTNMHNLFTWKALMLYRAGILWGNEAWLRLGTDILRKVVQVQNPGGWWSEGGPVVGYNLITAQAISLYAELSEDQEARTAMEKSARYHEIFSYPDSLPVETLDGRQRSSHSHVVMSHFIPPSFARFPEGRAYLERVSRALSKKQDFDIMNIHAFSFFGFVHDHLPNSSESVIGNNGMTRIIPALHSAVMRQDGWCCTLCGYENIADTNGFRLERQNLLSVWHEKTGLILGGGHSKFQPEFSCFNVIDRKAGSLYYLHANPRIQAQDKEIKLAITYGGLPISLSVKILDQRRAMIRYSVTDFSEDVFLRFMVRVNLIMVGRPGIPIQCEKHREDLDTRSFLWTEEDFKNSIEHNGWKLRIPQRNESVAVKWPLYPYNSYRRDRRSELKEAAMVASAQLLPDEPAIEYEIEIL
jgi:hypothetical protein